jgi:hypothetical protein
VMGSVSNVMQDERGTHQLRSYDGSFLFCGWQIHPEHRRFLALMISQREERTAQTGHSFLFFFPFSYFGKVNLAVTVNSCWQITEQRKSSLQCVISCHAMSSGCLFWRGSGTKENGFRPFRFPSRLKSVCLVRCVR